MENQMNSPSKFLSWLIFFIIYTFGYLAYAAYTQTHGGITFYIANFFLQFLTYGLFFSTALIVVAAFISSQAMARSFSKTLLFVLIGTVTITIYRSFSYFLFFFQFDQVLLIFCLLLLAGVSGYLFKFLYNKNSLLSKLLTTVILLIVVVGSSFYGFFIPNTITSTQCSNFSDRSQRLGCFYDLGIKNSNLDNCLEVSSEIMSPGGPDCAREVLANLEGQGRLNATLCETWTNVDARSVCYYKLAVLKHDKVLCEKVVDTYKDGNMWLAIKKPEPMQIASPSEKQPSKKECLSDTAN